MDNNSLTGTACIITGGLLDDIHAKTAHGLIRQSDRFKIIGIIDDRFAGRDAGEVLDGKHRNIPIFTDLDALIKGIGENPDYAIIGMATNGGILPKELFDLTRHVIEHKIGIVNGLHQSIGDINEFALLAKKNDVKIIDIRKPKNFDQLNFWTGKIKEVTSLKIGVLGTDCALGKRTTSKFLVNELTKNSIKTEMIYSGQTGWLQGGKYGFIFDATPNDFISGELEHAIYECWKNENPDVIILEGQSALRNPSGPCGSEYIISCELDGVILQHSPVRKYYNGLENCGKEIPSLKSEIALIRLLGTETLAIGLNTADMNESEIKEAQRAINEETGLPVFLPLEEGVTSVIPIIKSKLSQL